MKRLDRTTDRLMTRLVLPLFFAVLLAAPVLNGSAVARDTAAQGWVPTKNISFSLDTAQPTGDTAAAKVSLSEFNPVIQFDPRQLDNSRFAFTVRFTSSTTQGRSPRDGEAASMIAQFTSEEIRKTSDTTFEVHGYFRMNNRTQRLVLPLGVAAQTVNGVPTLTFSGRFLAPAGASAPALGLPKQLPVTFMVETVAGP